MLTKCQLTLCKPNAIRSKPNDPRPIAPTSRYCPPARHDRPVVGGEREKPKMTNAQNIVVIGSGHLLSILAENDLLRAENTRLRATIERSLKPAPVGTCPVGGEHDWPTGAKSYTGVCLKCGRGR